MSVDSGAAGGGVDLLANGSGGSHQAGRSGASGDERYAFDGTSSAVAVPPAVLNHTLAAHFTVSVWMRHNNSLARDQHADKRHSPKEHIVCNADGDGERRGGEGRTGQGGAGRGGAGRGGAGRGGAGQGGGGENLSARTDKICFGIATRT